MSVSPADRSHQRSGAEASETEVAESRLSSASRRPGALSAARQAQSLAWGPLFFQAARVLRDRGFLAELIRRPMGATPAELAAATSTSEYGATVLLEAGLSAGVVSRHDGHYRVTRVGLLVERDEMTRRNMNFVQDVCYRAIEHLDEAIEQGAPKGLSELGEWPTVYEGLCELSEPARSSWLEFDHFYSDTSFPEILGRVFESSPRVVLDVGGNTGKFATACLKHDPDVRLMIADLPGQLRSCERNVTAAGFSDRVSYHPVDFLSKDASLPEGADVIWMSQFLCCFSEPEIVTILEHARRTMTGASRLLIMDTFWDRQETDAATVVLHGTSLYFTVLANGNSRMYDGETFERCIERAGLVRESRVDHIGYGHTLLTCRLP